MENDSQKALDALRGIDEILSQFRESFPSTINNLPKRKDGGQTDPMKLLKRVNGIIKGFNENNAIRKVGNLIKLFDAIRKRAAK